MSRSSLSRLAVATLAMVVVAAGVPNPAVAVEPTTGIITGRFVDRAGNGLADYQVHLYRDGGEGAFTMTNFDGSFTAEVQPGLFQVSFHRFADGSSFIQYVPGTDTPNEANWFDVAAGQTITVNDTRYATGMVTGKFTDRDGAPMAGVSVAAARYEYSGVLHTTTDQAGEFRFPFLRAGPAWRFEFLGVEPSFRQYAYGAVTFEQATQFTVVEGQTLVVNDSRLPTANVKVVARDESGAPVPRFSISLGNAGYADGEDGQALVTDVSVGTHEFIVNAEGFEESTGSVTVVEGQQAEITVTLQGKSRIVATVVDAETGEPVSGVCLVVAQPLRLRLPDGCWTESTSSGKVLVETSGAGVYQVLAFPVNAPGYGAQWVGPASGSGNQLAAKLIRVEEGKAGNAPVIKMDRAGTITGTVTQSDGTLVPWGTVAIGDFSSFVGAGLGTVEINEEGRYTIDFLGPYQWPLMFWAGPDGIQWSGGVGNRFLADKVKVTSGQQATFDHRYKVPVKLTANVTGVTGDCYIFAANAVTRDTVMSGWGEDCTQPLIDAVVGPQLVKFSLFYYDGEEWRERWAGGEDFDHATPYFIPGHGTKTVNLNF